MNEIEDLEEHEINCHSKKEVSTLRKYAISMGVFIAIGWGLVTYTQLLEVASESLEGIRYILILKGSKYKRGDIVSICGHTPLYGESHVFTKRVVGLPGDHITRTKGLASKKSTSGHIKICANPSSVSTLFSLLKTTKDGYPLIPLSHSVVPEGYIFVAGDHPRSFDSRYEEFGLVPIQKICGKAVWTW